MATAIDVFVQAIRPQVSGCLDMDIEDAVIRGCRELARRAKVPTHEATLTNTGALRYAITMPDANHEPARILVVKNDGAEMQSDTYTLDELTGEAVFTAAPSGQIKVKVALRPKKGVSQVNDAFALYDDAVNAYALWWLKRQSGTDWHDPDGARQAEDDFDRRAGRIARMALKGNTEQRVRVTGHYY